MAILNWISGNPRMAIVTMLFLAAFTHSLAIKLVKMAVWCVWVWRNPGGKVDIQ